MSRTHSCPSCHKIFGIPDVLLSKLVECPHCKERVQVDERFIAPQTRYERSGIRPDRSPVSQSTPAKPTNPAAIATIFTVGALSLGLVAFANSSLNGAQRLVCFVGFSIGMISYLALEIIQIFKITIPPACTTWLRVAATVSCFAVISWVFK